MFFPKTANNTFYNLQSNAKHIYVACGNLLFNLGCRCIRDFELNTAVSLVQEFKKLIITYIRYVLLERQITVILIQLRKKVYNIRIS